MPELMRPFMSEILGQSQTAVTNKVGKNSNRDEGKNFAKVLNAADNKGRNSKKAITHSSKPVNVNEDKELSLKSVQSDDDELELKDMIQQIQNMYSGKIPFAEALLLPSDKAVDRQVLGKAINLLDKASLNELKAALAANDADKVIKLLQEPLVNVLNVVSNHEIDEITAFSNSNNKKLFDFTTNTQQDTAVIDPKLQAVVADLSKQQNISPDTEKVFSKAITENMSNVAEPKLTQSFNKLQQKLDSPETAIKTAIQTALTADKSIPTKEVLSKPTVNMTMSPLVILDKPENVVTKISGSMFAMNHVQTAALGKFSSSEEGMLQQSFSQNTKFIDIMPQQMVKSDIIPFQSLLQPIVATDKLTDLTKVDNANPMDPYQVMDQVIEHVKLIQKPGTSEMVIKLNPEHLGELTLKVAVDNGTVSATFHTVNQDVKSIIESSLLQLKQEMLNQGLKVNYVGVYTGLNQFGEGQRQQQSFQQQKFKRVVKVDEEFIQTVDKVSASSLSESDSVDYLI